MRPAELHEVSKLTEKQVQELWEEAYTRFETNDQEIKKFVYRLNKLGQSRWRRDARTVDIFCGRGNGLKALEKLGFTNLEGVDISSELLSKYIGNARLYKADCRKLPFEDQSRDLIIVQGGLHHLTNLPEDLIQTLSEVRRVLKDEGKFVMVEPWETPFLKAIHFLSERRIMRVFSRKFDAFAVMTHYEANTYFNWLNKPVEILNLLENNFKTVYRKKQMGKLFYIGQKIIEQYRLNNKNYFH